MKKYVKYCGVAFVLLIVLVITYYVGRGDGRYNSFIETNRAYYEHRGAGDLLDQYAFPYPFLAKYVESHGLVTRQEIDAIMQGYVRMRSRKDADGYITDTYEFNMGGWDNTYIHIHYHSPERLDFVDESGSAVFLGR